MWYSQFLILTQRVSLVFTDLQYLQDAIHTGSANENVPAQSFTPQIQYQDIIPSGPGSASRHNTRSQTNAPPITATHQLALAAAPSAISTPVHDSSAEASSTEPSLKRKRGRPRKHPLPPPPREPSPDPTADLGRAELTQLISATRQDRGEDEEFLGVRYLRSPPFIPRPLQSASEDTAQTIPVATPFPTTLPPFGHRPVAQPPLPPVVHAPSLAQPYIQPPSDGSRRLPEIPAAAAAAQPLPQIAPAGGPSMGPEQRPLDLTPPAVVGRLATGPEPIAPRTIAPAVPGVNTSALAGQPFHFPEIDQGPIRFPASAFPPTSHGLHRATAPQIPALPRFDPNSQDTTPSALSSGFGQAVPPNQVSTAQQVLSSLQTEPPWPSLSPIRQIAAPSSSQSPFARSLAPSPQPALVPREPEEVYRDPRPDTPSAASNTTEAGEQGLRYRVPVPQPRDVAAASQSYHNHRLVSGLLAVYLEQNPTWYTSGFNPASQRVSSYFSISPRASTFPLTSLQEEPDNMVFQPQYPRNSQSLFPLFTYLGRDLNQGPLLPAIAISGGPQMPCFEQDENPDRVDVGFGPGIRIADAFEELARKYDWEQRKEAIDSDRALYGMGVMS
jgi:hypothetical protein